MQAVVRGGGADEGRAPRSEMQSPGAGCSWTIKTERGHQQGARMRGGWRAGAAGVQTLQGPVSH